MRVGILPLNITFKEALDCYEENVIDILIEKIKGYKGTCIEIGLNELDIKPNFLHSFRKLEKLFQNRLKKETKVKYEIKTTGAGLTEDQAELFRKKNITVCLLMDGAKNIHEQNNCLLKRPGTHEQAVCAAELLTRCNVNFYIGITVTSVVAMEIQQVFAFLIKNGWNSHAYWPVLCETDRQTSEKILTTKEYQYFLEHLFMLWKEKRIKKEAVYVREFENFAGSIKGFEPLISSVSGRCPFQNVFLPDGNIYSRGCQSGQSEYLCEYPKEQRLQLTKSINVKTECKLCRWVSLCQSNRTCCMNTEIFCEIYKNFYLSALPDMFELLRTLGR